MFKYCWWMVVNWCNYVFVVVGVCIVLFMRICDGVGLCWCGVGGIGIDYFFVVDLVKQKV